MSVKAVYFSTLLPEAPERGTLAEAEADDCRGAELQALLYALPMLTGDQRRAAQTRFASGAATSTSAWDAAYVALKAHERYAAWRTVWSRAQSQGASDAMRGSFIAVLVRDRISLRHFDSLTAPMRAAGIVDFDNLVNVTVARNSQSQACEK